MSARPGDWHPLTEDGDDPFDGDWELVKEAAARYRRTADFIQRAQVLLREVTDSREGWRSEAGEAFRETAADLSGNVFKAYGRYDATADALAGYWPVLQDVQEESLDLLRQARQVQDEIDSVGPRAEAAEDEESDTHDQHAALQGQLESARGELERLRARLAELIEEKDVAAQRAADAIGDFIGHDGLKDSWWDRHGHLLSLSHWLDAVGEVAGQIAMLAGLASLALCWVPVLGQALGAIATIATALSLMVNLLRGDWRGVLLDSVGLLTFGLGRAAGAAARTARGRGAFSVFQNARRSLPPGLSPAQKVAELRRLGLTPSAALGARNAAQEAAGLAGQSVSIFGRSVTPGALGWTRYAFRNVGPDLASSLRAPFGAGNWSLATTPRQMAGLTDMGSAASAAAGAAGQAAQRAAMAELGGVLAGTASTLATLDDNWMPDFNVPDSIPFSELPGLSLNMESPWPAEAAEVGAFSYQESEAAAR
ncbi:hypothetical protein [Streptomyces hoynatensis]|uniref:WXG100 family type VII secretion target n=1 Tax=Streptomyces hoynatensis TaxID=1141874 RepID=A0A3A9ZAR8_9ACTN|nr:hypothetical protein [Streptomyces hoynatensis]RKN45552.1 hypothetical protein D7294_03460 [Streptomyces hoynatensis]